MDGLGNDDLALVTKDPDGATGFNPGLSTNGGFWMKPEWWRDRFTDWSSMTPLAGDVTGDGKADFVYLIPTTSGSQAWVLPSSGVGLQPPRLWWNGAGYLYAGIKPSLGDVNGDGTEDLILATAQAGGGTAVSPALSTGAGFWLQPPWWTDRYTDWANMTPLVGNFTGDMRNGRPVADFGYIIPTAAGAQAWVLPSTTSSLEAPQSWWVGNGWGYAGIKVARR